VTGRPARRWVAARRIRPASRHVAHAQRSCIPCAWTAAQQQGDGQVSVAIAGGCDNSYHGESRFSGEPSDSALAHAAVHTNICDSGVRAVALPGRFLPRLGPPSGGPFFWGGLNAPGPPSSATPDAAVTRPRAGSPRHPGRRARRSRRPARCAALRTRGMVRSGVRRGRGRGRSRSAPHASTGWADRSAG